MGVYIPDVFGYVGFLKSCVWAVGELIGLVPTVPVEVIAEVVRPVEDPPTQRTLVGLPPPFGCWPALGQFKPRRPTVGLQRNPGVRVGKHVFF